MCSIDGCGKVAIAKGLCSAHYKRLERHGDPAITIIKATEKGAARAFFSHLKERADKECIYWPFARSSSGYGRITLNGRSQPVHRLVCEIAHGSPPTPRHEAAHSCGQGHLGCVNPLHVSWKTPRDNQADRIVHGTDLRGAQIGTAKLNDDSVRTIRALYDTGVHSQRSIAARFGVGQNAVKNIVLRRTWKHVS